MSPQEFKTVLDRPYSTELAQMSYYANKPFLKKKKGRKIIIFSAHKFVRNILLIEIFQNTKDIHFILYLAVK